MSILSFLGSIIGAIGKVAGVVGSIIRISKPILEHMRPMVDEIDAAMDWMEDNASVVGEEGDEFLDANMGTINDLEAVAARGQVVFGKIHELTVALRVASQENTPDRIDEAEAAEFIRLFGEIKDAIGPWRSDLDTAIESMGDVD